LTEGGKEKRTKKPKRNMGGWGREKNRGEERAEIQYLLVMLAVGSEGGGGEGGREVGETGYIIVVPLRSYSIMLCTCSEWAESGTPNANNKLHLK
jgi:hypothetical protein